MKLIVGLGNPGKKYEGTRHNVGFVVLDELICSIGNKWSEGKGPFWVNGQPFENGKVIVAKPATFMNESGKAVKTILKQYKISPDQTLVVIDDVNLPIGKVRFRFRGSSGGHHGLESIMEELKTKNFPRLRVGVSTDDLSGQNLTDFVLGKFSKEEQAILAPEIDRARDACLEWIKTDAVSSV